MQIIYAGPWGTLHQWPIGSSRHQNCAPIQASSASFGPCHEGHLGIVGTRQNLRSKVYWPGMDKAAEKHCKSCHGCQLVAQPNPPEPIRSTALPDAPWQHLAADLMGPIPSGHSILVVVDYYNRFYEYEILRSTTTDKVADAMEEMFSRHGLPLTIKTDNGPQFKAAEFNAYCTANCITHVKSHQSGHKPMGRWRGKIDPWRSG